MVTVEQLLSAAVDQGASDIHMAAMSVPHIRVCGRLRPLGYPQLGGDDLERLVMGLMDDAQIRKYREKREVEFAASIPTVGRFRINAFYQQGQAACVIRYILPSEELEEVYSFPDEVMALSELQSGLVLVNGPSRSGRSTTLAAILERINMKRPVHIITLEHPVEYIYRPEKAVISQRDVGTDVFSYEDGLKGAMHADADVIMLGEVESAGAARLALSAAESGCLVFASLPVCPHSSGRDAQERLLGMFPPAEDRQMRRRLADCLKAAVTQWVEENDQGNRVVFEIEA